MLQHSMESYAFFPVLLTLRVRALHYAERDEHIILKVVFN
jgi:hypothetical protein